MDFYGFFDVYLKLTAPVDYNFRCHRARACASAPVGYRLTRSKFEFRQMTSWSPPDWGDCMISGDKRTPPVDVNRAAESHLVIFHCRSVRSPHAVNYMGSKCGHSWFLDEHHVYDSGGR